MSEDQSTPADTSLRSIFDSKYFEFAIDLKGTLPELTEQIKGAIGIPKEDRYRIFVEQVIPSSSPFRNSKECPGIVLPGVVITNELWDQLSEKSQKAIHEYITLLSFCCIYDGLNSSSPGDINGNKMRFWSDDFLKTWRDKLSNTDFTGLSSKIAELMKTFSIDSLPSIPERFLKGHLSKLVDELVREFRPEDFGLTVEELESCNEDPTKAFQLLTDIYTNKPELLQNVIKRIAKKLQDKVKKGEIRPEQIAAEAEELIKEFSENKSLVDMLESFRSIFGMEDMDIARDAGREGDARRNIVKERLRKKLEAKKAAGKK